MTRILLAFAFLFVATSGPNAAAPIEAFRSQGSDPAHPLSGETKLSCSEKALDDDLDFLVAPIKSVADLQRHARFAKAIHSPLMHLPALARKRFLDSVTFNDTGVTGYRLDVLQDALTVSQAYQVLALFGEQRDVRYLDKAAIESDLDREVLRSFAAATAKAQCDDDKVSYKCVSRATCQSATGFICKSNC